MVGHWERAVELGARGWYAAARAALDQLAAASAPGSAQGSLALSTRASLMRQLGGHVAAAEVDGAAYTEAASGATASHRVARSDALIGLAADALGPRRLSLAAALLDRAEAEAAQDARTAVRLQWVRAELALSNTDFGTARQHAELAAKLAAELGSPRHQLKSELLVAATRSASEPEAAVAQALAVMEGCGQRGLVPLEWAAAMLASGVAQAGSAAAAQANTVRDRADAVLASRGGIIR